MLASTVVSFIVFCLVSLLATIIVIRFSLPIRLLSGLNVYLLPSTNQNQAAAASSSKSRSKKKGGGSQWDSSPSSMMKVVLQESHIISRKYFKEFDESILFAAIGLLTILAREILLAVMPSVQNQIPSSSPNSSDSVGDTPPPADSVTTTPFSEQLHLLADTTSFVPFLLLAVSSWRLLRNWAVVTFHPSTTRTNDYIQCGVAGAISLLILSLILFTLPAHVLLFDFDSAAIHICKSATAQLTSRGVLKPGSQQLDLPSWVLKVIVSVAGSLLSALSLPAALRFVRNFVIATSHRHWDGEVFQRRPLTQALWSVAFLLPVLCVPFWITPMVAVFFSTEPLSVEDLHTRISPFSASSTPLAFGGEFGILLALQFSLLLLSSLSRLLLARPAIQTYLSAGTVYWYQIIHGNASLPPSTTTTVIQARLQVGLDARPLTHCQGPIVISQLPVTTCYTSLVLSHSSRPCLPTTPPHTFCLHVLLRFPRVYACARLCSLLQFAVFCYHCPVSTCSPTYSLKVMPTVQALH